MTQMIISDGTIVSASVNIFSSSVLGPYNLSESKEPFQWQLPLLLMK